MIHVSHLYKSYSGTPILQDVSFTINKGEIVGFLGPNGAGKTTTMRILTGYLPPSKGTVKIAGFDVTEDSLRARQHVGYLPEHVPLYLDLTVDEYLSFFARIMGVSRSMMKQSITDVEEKTGLLHVRKKLIGSLSRGYRQRVGLAQALIGKPDVLIFDEPTVGLDPVQIIEIRELIKNLAREQTVILSTHILPEVSQICNRVIIINKGMIVADGNVHDLTKKEQKKNIFSIVLGHEDNRIMQLIKKVNGVLHVAGKDVDGEYVVQVEATSDIRHALLKQLVENSADIREFRSEKFDLEDVFLKLVTEEKH